MKKDRLILGKSLISLLVLLVGFFALSYLNNSHAVLIPVDFFTPQFFWPGVAAAQKAPVHTDAIRVALVPHHLVAGELISRIFESLRAQKVNHVIIISPNHYEAGTGSIQTSNHAWQTPFGRVPGMNLGTEFPEASRQIMKVEHGVSGLMPYIAYYLPQARVSSIILKYRTSDAQVARLAEELSPQLSQDTVLLASVDFSHYLPYPVAEARDQLTGRLLLELNESPLYNLNNDYLDSPPALALLIKVCRLTGSKSFLTTGHSNSAVILSDPYLQSTTSHFSGWCEKK